MTALNNAGIFLLNATSGSDTLASGLGPATAEYGSNASITSGSAEVTAIDTSNLSAGDVIWVDTTTGRQFNVIASVDNATDITCDQTWGETASYLNWAVGGKRATLTEYGNLLEFTMSQEFTISLETDATYDASNDWSGGTNFRNIVSSDASTLRTISVDSTYMQRGGNTRFRNLKIQATGTGNQYIFQNDLTYGSVTCRAVNVTFSDDSNEFYAINDGNVLQDRNLDLDADACLFNSFGQAVFEDRVQVHITNSIFRGGSRICGAQVNYVQEFVNCIFDKAGSFTTVSPDTVTNNLLIRRCIFNRCGSIFTRMFPQNSSTRFSDFSSNVLVGCTFGADSCTGGDNNYAHSTTMPSTFTNTTTLANDPLVDGANNDANIDDSTAGNVLRAIAYSDGSSNSILPYRNFVTDDFGGGSVIVIED